MWTEEGKQAATLWTAPMTSNARNEDEIHCRLGSSVFFWSGGADHTTTPRRSFGLVIFTAPSPVQCRIYKLISHVPLSGSFGSVPATCSVPPREYSGLFGRGVSNGGGGGGCDLPGMGAPTLVGPANLRFVCPTFNYQSGFQKGRGYGLFSSSPIDWHMIVRRHPDFCIW